MLDYIQNIIVPYVDNVRDHSGVGKEKSALAIFDHFKGQLIPAVTNALEENNIYSALVPATCTDRLQPLDLSVNKSAKMFLRSEFQKWYANQINSQLSEDDSITHDFEPVEL